MKKTIVLGMVALMVLMFGACKKPKDGAPGAQGPQGNANVTYGIFNVPASSWGYTSPTYYATLLEPTITQDILDKGAILVYMGSTSQWVQLPVTFYPSSTYSELIKPIFTLGQVEVDITDSDLTQPATPTAKTFKVVVIASRSMLINPNVDFSNYESVKKAFNLKD